MIPPSWLLPGRTLVKGMTRCIDERQKSFRPRIISFLSIHLLYPCHSLSAHLLSTLRGKRALFPLYSPHDQAQYLTINVSMFHPLNSLNPAPPLPPPSVGVKSSADVFRPTKRLCLPRSLITLILY